MTRKPAAPTPPPSEIVRAPSSSRELSTELAATAERAAEYAFGSRAEGTLRTYRSHWGSFKRWCADHGLESLPATPQTVALYVAALASGAARPRGTDGLLHEIKPSTIGVHLAAIRYVHRKRRLPSPTDDEGVREVMDGVQRKHGTRPNRKAPAVVDVLRALVDALPGHSPRAVRDRAVVLLGFAGAFRRSELVGLDWTDIAPREAGLLVTLRRSKTDQRGAGRAVHVHRAVYSTDPCCPVRAVNAWRDVARDVGTYSDAGPVFVSLARGSWGDRLGSRTVALTVKRAARVAGLDAARYAGHSLRSGFATAAARAGRRYDSIRAVTGHKSLDMLARYLADEAPWDDDAGKGLL